MPLPPVVVDLGPSPPAELAQVLVSACSVAVPDGECMLATETGRPGEARTRVVVIWQQPEQRRALLHIVHRRDDRTDQLRRAVEFKLEDTPTERWRAVGFVVGALVGRITQTATAAPVASQAERPARGAERAARVPPAPRVGNETSGPTLPDETAEPPARYRPIWAAIGPLAGPGLDSGMWRFGGWLRGGYAFEAVPLLVCGAVSYAARPEDDQLLSADWLSLGAGGGLHASLQSIRLGLQARAEVIAERVGVAATDPATGVEESGSHWKAGARLGLDAWWPSDAVAGVVLGTEGWLLGGQTDIRLRGVSVASTPAASFALAAGVRVALP